MLRSHAIARLLIPYSVTLRLHRLCSRLSFVVTTEVMPKRRVPNPAGGATRAMPVSSSHQGIPITSETSQITTPKAKKRARMPEASPHVQSNMTQLQPKALAIAEHLRKLYPNPPIPLDHKSDFQLLCAVVLSAQTTDKKVNEATPALFQLAPDAAAMATADVSSITECIRQLGLAPTKAKNLKALSQVLAERHGGAVPDSFDELEALPGVGHKTASVVMAQVHGHDAFPVDTHIHRLAQRWGLTKGSTVEQTEADLKHLFPPKLWKDLHLQIIFFGREKCPAKGHDPRMCPICSWAAVSPYDKPGNSPLKAGQRGAAGGSIRKPRVGGAKTQGRSAAVKSDEKKAGALFNDASME